MDKIVMPARMRSTRGWLVLAIAAAGLVAWVAVAWASARNLEYSGYLGVVGIALTLGSLEVAYLVWHGWKLGQTRTAIAATVTASAGSLLIFIATVIGVTAPGFAALASGVGLLGFSCAIGLLGLYRGAARTTATSLSALLIALMLAYFASLLWAAVP